MPLQPRLGVVRGALRAVWASLGVAPGARFLRVAGYVLGAGGVVFGTSAPAWAAWNTDIGQSPTGTGANVCGSAWLSSVGTWTSGAAAFSGNISRMVVEAYADPSYNAGIGQYFPAGKDIRRVAFFQGYGVAGTNNKGDTCAVAIGYSDSNTPASASIVGIYPAVFGANSIEIPSQGSHRGWWLFCKGLTGSGVVPPFSETLWSVEELEMYEGTATPTPSPSASSSATPTPAPTATPTPGVSPSPGESPTPEPSASADADASGTVGGLYADEAYSLAMNLNQTTDWFFAVLFCSLILFRVASYSGVR